MEFLRTLSYLAVVRELRLVSTLWILGKMLLLWRGQGETDKGLFR